MGVGDLTASFAQALNVHEGARLRFAPARSGVISWNTFAEAGCLRFRLLRMGVPASAWHEYARWDAARRSSASIIAAADGLRVEVDVIEAEVPFDGIDLRADGVDFGLLAFASPHHAAPSLPYAGQARILDVPPLSQYTSSGERGWCSPTSLAMVHAYHGIAQSVEVTARAVADEAYGGTGNWAFNVAYSGSLGFRGVVAYLRNLDQAQQLIERNLPVIISYSWTHGDLPGAPLEHSQGHLVVLRGFTADGDCAINDPAAPNVRVVYPRAAIERLWQRHGGGVAYVIAPVGIEYADVLTA